MLKINKRNLMGLLWVSLLFLTPFVATGQGDVTESESNKPTIDASFSKDTILIGDQIYLQLTVNKDVAQVVALPEITTAATEGKIEILGLPEIDTLEVDGRQVTIQARYKVTSFDEGRYGINSFPLLYIDKNIQDTIYSDSVALVVASYVIDTATYVMADIKPRLEEKFTFDELKYYVATLFSSPYTYFGLLLALLVIVLIWYIRRRRARKNEPKIIEPPHIIAIRDLVNIDNKKLWQNGKVKQYYTELSDVIRVYLHGRYGVNAMEMTSIEIFEALREEGIPAKEFEKLRELLILSDYVKFAKISPTQDENSDSYNQAYYFVEETKLLPLEVEINQEKQG